jgi:hypothetical protein
MEAAFAAARRLYPTAARLDFRTEVLKFDEERLADQPDLARFPELKGHADLLAAERQAFMSSTGLDRAAAAFHFSWSFYLSRRVDTRHLARYDLLAGPGKGCTNVFFPDGVEGVTLSDNRDIPLPVDVSKLAAHRPEELLKQDPVHWIQGGVSAGVLMDDEPACVFPANPMEYDLMPKDSLTDIDEIIVFMSRYNEFWGPCNTIWCDRSLRAAAVEKTNCMMAVRRPTVNGAVAVTACAYLDPKLSAHQLERARRAMKMKGENESNALDLNYHLGSGRRYRRLVELTDAEAKRGATLWGALAVASDHAVPYPDRVCLAGETMFPEREPAPNWSVTNHAAVISGPNRRCLYRSVQSSEDAEPVYEHVPKLMLGPGVKMRPEWQADVDAGRCVLAEPVGK